MTAKQFNGALKRLKDSREWTQQCLEVKPVTVLNRDKLGRMMRQLRGDSGISLRQVARVIGVSAPFLSDCERGNRQLNLVDLQEFINACVDA